MQTHRERAHAKQIQRMHSVLLACGTNGRRMHRWTCVRNTLGVRSLCARCSLDLSRRIYNEYPSCAPCVFCVGPMCSAYVCRPSGVYIHVSSSAHIVVHAQQSQCNPDHTANDNECIALIQRARRTSNECRRTPSVRQRACQNCYFVSARAVRRACVSGALHVLKVDLKT